MVALLSHPTAFPPATSANEDGLVAVGGDLSPRRVLHAYAAGIFPWPVFEDHMMTWFSPDPRAILPLDALHIPRSLKRSLRTAGFSVTFNECFADVLDACRASTTKRPTTWITDNMRDAYVELHRLGYAHSAEVWHDAQLVGGLYGLALRGLFAGESMFSRATDASKVAVVRTVERLRSNGFRLFDIQQQTPHLKGLGAVEVSRDAYLRQLAQGLRIDARFDRRHPPDPSIAPPHLC